MDEWKHEWVEEDKKRRMRCCRPWEGGPRPSMCLSVCCVNTGDQEEPMEKKKRPVGQTDSWPELVGTAFRGVAGRGEGDETTHRSQPFLLILTCPSTQRLNLQKEKQNKKNIKVHKNGLKFNYSVVYTWLKKKKNNYQPANVWELHPLLMVFLMINKYVNNYGDEHKWSVFRSIVYISLNIQRDRRMLENGLRRMSEVGMDVRECAVSLWMEARLLSVNKRQCPSVCYCLQCLLCL